MRRDLGDQHHQKIRVRINEATFSQAESVEFDGTSSGAGMKVSRVAALVAATSVSGPGRQLAALAKRLATRGVGLQVVLFQRATESPPYAEHLRSLGVMCQVVQDRHALDRQLISTVADVLRRWQTQIVQTHGYKATGVGWALRRSELRIPWIGCFHGYTTESFRARLYHQLDRIMLGSADRILVMSSRQAADFRRYGGRVQVMPNALVPLVDGPGAAADAARISSLMHALPRPRLGVVGRLSPEKGIDIFLNACRSLTDRGLTFSAVIAGDGPERPRLEHFARQFCRGSRTLFLGHVDAVATLYRELDMLVLPSRSEGLPNALLEGLGMDLRVVATDVGAVRDVLREPAAGRVVAPGSAELLADAIEATLAEDPAHGRVARRQATERFSLEHRTNLHLALYESVLTERAARAQRVSGGTY